MSTIPINLAIEDRVSEAVLRRLLEHVNRGYVVGTAYWRTGYGYLYRTIVGWNRAARGIPFIVLTDLDTLPCPGQLVESWLGRTRHPNLLLCVAVREVEAWLLADAINLSSYLAVHLKRMPEDPDALPDPKQVLISLAARSRSSDIRKRLVPNVGSTARQGRDHNNCLSTFVNTTWDVDSAQTKSPSLQRTIAKLEVFRPTWEPD